MDRMADSEVVLMRARIYKRIGDGVYLGTSLFIGGIFYTLFVLLGLVGIACVVYYVVT